MVDLYGEGGELVCAFPFISMSKLPGYHDLLRNHIMMLLFLYGIIIMEYLTHLCLMPLYRFWISRKVLHRDRWRSLFMWEQSSQYRRRR